MNIKYNNHKAINIIRAYLDFKGCRRGNLLRWIENGVTNHQQGRIINEEIFVWIYVTNSVL